jgi:hypothetical protein
MPSVEVDIDDGVLSELEYLADEEFTNQEEAVERLLAAGLTAYSGDDSSVEDEMLEEYTDMWESDWDPF